MKYYCDNQRHLVCEPYSIENLHKMAVNLRIPLCWYHGGDKPHYDIPKNRVKEIKRFCKVIRPREILNIITKNTMRQKDDKPTDDEITTAINNR